MLIPKVEATFTAAPDAEGVLELDAGAILGLTDRLTADATFLPLILAPEFRYGDPTIGATYLLSETKPLDMAATVHVTFNTGRGSAIRPLEPGINVRLRFDPDIRVDTGAYVPLTLGRTSAMGIRVPASLSVQLTNHIHAGVDTGLTLKDFTRARRSAAIPLGISAGYSAAVRRGVTVNVLPFISWPTFLATGGKKAIQADHIVVGVVSTMTLPR